MQTLTIGAYRATLKPTRNVGEFTAKLAKCNGKSRRLPLRDMRTKAGFPVFEPGMSTAEYVRLYSSGDGSQLKAWEWAQLNSEPCTLYSGEDTCETLPDGFDTWEDFDAAQSSNAAADSAPAAANDDAAPSVPDPGPAAPSAAAEIAPTDAEPVATFATGFAHPRLEVVVVGDRAPAASARTMPADTAAARSAAPRSREAFDAATVAAADTLARLTVAFAPDRSRAALIDRGRVGAIGARGAIVAELTRLADAKHWHGWREAGRALADLAAADAAPSAPDAEPAAPSAAPTTDHVPTHSQTAPVADPLATHSAADNGGFAHRVATAAAFISSGRNPTRAFDNCLEMYDGAAVAVALMRRADRRPGSKMAANIWRYLCRAATESSAAEQPADMSLAEWSRVLIQRAQSESNAMRADPLPSESEPNPVPGKLDAAPAVDSGPPASDSSADPAEVKREADRAAALADAMARFTRGARVTAEPAHYFDGRPVAGWPNAQFLGTVRECFDNRGMATVRVKWDSGRTDLTSAARLAIVPLPSEFGPDPLPGELGTAQFDRGRVSLILHNVLVPLQNAAPDGVPSVAGLESEAARLDASAAIMAGDDYADDAQRRCGTRIAADYREVARSLRELAEIERDRIDDIEGVDETMPAPFDGVDVAELGPDGMAEFERAGGIAQPIALAYRDDAPRATPTPYLRISPSDPRARIPDRFAPVYLLQA